MSKVIIGLDPDSKAHGVAVYKDGKLIKLKCMPLTELMGVFREYESRNPILHIEDVCNTSAAFTGRDSRGNQAVKMKMAQHIGQCKQAQIEVERMAEYYGIQIVRHKISKAWKKDRALFERITGWDKQSNEDTRSAAYFGFLGAK